MKLYYPTDRSQQGSVSLTFIVVLVGLIAAMVFTVWRVREADKETTTETTVASPDTARTDGSSANNTASHEVPKGWVEFEDEEFGLKFVYPSSWGEVSVEEVEWAHSGVGLAIKFSESAVMGMAASNDYEYTGGGRGGVYWEIGEADFAQIASQELDNAKKAEASEGYSTVVLSRSDNVIVSASGDCLQGGAVVVGSYDISDAEGALAVLRFGHLNSSNIHCDQLTASNVTGEIDEEIHKAFKRMGQMY